MISAVILVRRGQELERCQYLALAEHRSTAKTQSTSAVALTVHLDCRTSTCNSPEHVDSYDDCTEV